jgi:hypothetical protein
MSFAKMYFHCYWTAENVKNLHGYLLSILTAGWRVKNAMVRAEAVSGRASLAAN